MPSCNPTYLQPYFQLLTKSPGLPSGQLPFRGLRVFTLRDAFWDADAQEPCTPHNPPCLTPAPFGISACPARIEVSWDLLDLNSSQSSLLGLFNEMKGSYCGDVVLTLRMIMPIPGARGPNLGLVPGQVNIRLVRGSYLRQLHRAGQAPSHLASCEPHAGGAFRDLQPGIAMRILTDSISERRADLPVVRLGEWGMSRKKAMSLVKPRAEV